MEIILEKATVADAEAIHSLQVETFLPLLQKYKDDHTSPANETIERVLTRMNYPYGGFYKIIYQNILVGAIYVYRIEGTTQFWISPMFILPAYQGRGIAQKALTMIEEMFPEATSWELATLLEEERNCYLYEKIGFTKTGVSKALNEHATLVYYKRLQCP